MRKYNKWSWEEKNALILKVIEWAQKNKKDVYNLCLNDFFEAVKYK